MFSHCLLEVLARARLTTEHHMRLTPRTCFHNYFIKLLPDDKKNKPHKMGVDKELA